MRPTLRHTAAGALAALLFGACERGDSRGAGGPARTDGAPANPAADDARATALADTLGQLVADAYDFSRPDVVARLMALYAPTDPVVSAAAGRVTTSRAAVQIEVQRFWERVGQNMRDARFVMGTRHVTPLGPDAAVLTFAYAIPHQTPERRAHTIAGAWTAVFQRRAGRWVIVQEHLSDVPRTGASAAGTASP